jgi:cobalt/nickel transport system permease protein
MAPQAKLVAAFGIVASIAITPRRAVWAFAVYALLVGAVVLVAKVPPRFVLARLVAVAPFVLFALLIPFVSTGQKTELLGVSVSVEGLWGAWNILVKALLGASTTILLTATTEVADIIRGMGTLRVPALFTSIAAFMIRYLELITDELRRMRVAMTARGYAPTWLAQARPIATSAGALFVRSYERGERVHAAMLSRGFTGEMPRVEDETVPPGQWLLVLAVVAFTVGIAGLAMVTT